MQNSRVELRYLRHVVELAKHRNFHRASEVLCITQPALTKSIQNIEGILGVKLFDRFAQDVVPTHHCEVIVNHANVVFQELEKMQFNLEELSSVQRGKLRFGCGPQIPISPVAKTIAAIRELHPKLHFEVVIERWYVLTKMLRDGDIEMCVCDIDEILREPDLLLESLPAMQNLAVCRFGHPLAAKGTLTPEDLLEYPLVLPWFPQRGLEWLKANAPERISPDDYLEQAIQVWCDSQPLTYRILQETDCITMGSEHLFRERIDRLLLSKLELTDFTPISDTRPGVVTLRNRTLPATIDLLVKTLRKSFLKLLSE